MTLLSPGSKLDLFLDPHLKLLISDGEKLLGQIAKGEQVYSDYSFIVFPFAKAYEGFLKAYFFQANLISELEFNSDHFRIGKALNPSLEFAFRHQESVYDRLAQKTGGKNLGDELWRVWKKGRNLLFHYFAHNYHAPTLFEAEEIIKEIIKAMETCLETVFIVPENWEIKPDSPKLSL